jgi:hypothetical protein
MYSGKIAVPPGGGGIVINKNKSYYSTSCASDKSHSQLVFLVPETAPVTPSQTVLFQSTFRNNNEEISAMIHADNVI